jgi:endoribonuclease Dicer
MRYLYNKFPTATSGQLSWARSRAVCAPALASVAVNVLGLHKPLLINNVELSMAISKYIPILQETSREEIIHSGWKHDPPKAISDVLESILGAVLVDTHYDFEKTCVIVENALRGLLVVLSPDMPRDPVSELMVWIARAGCMKISFRYAPSMVFTVLS